MATGLTVISLGQTETAVQMEPTAPGRDFTGGQETLDLIL